MHGTLEHLFYFDIPERKSCTWSRWAWPHAEEDLRGESRDWPRPSYLSGPFSVGFCFWQLCQEKFQSSLRLDRGNLALTDTEMEIEKEVKKVRSPFGVGVDRPGNALRRCADRGAGGENSVGIIDVFVFFFVCLVALTSKVVQRQFYAFSLIKVL